MPFHPQVAYQCGPAALATVLGWSGIDADPDALVSQVYVPDREGSLQPEMVAAARRAGRVPYPLPPAPAAIGAELAAGHPVLVLQNLGVGPLPSWHYAVVVGYDPAEGDFILRSGTEKSRRESVQRFMASWQRSGYWGLVVLAPGKLPASQPLAAPVIESLAQAEGFLPDEAAARSWRAVLERWPQTPDALFGAANALRRAGDHEAAIQTYQRLLRLEPGHVAGRNNFADLMLANGCPERAAALLEGIRTQDLAAPLAAALARTRRDIDSAAPSGGDAAYCRPQAPP